MEVREDVLGVTPEVGDTTVFNLPHHKGLVYGKCINYWFERHLEVDGFYSPKTGFVCFKNSSVEEII